MMEIPYILWLTWMRWLCFPWRTPHLGDRQGHWTVLQTKTIQNQLELYLPQTFVHFSGFLWYLSAWLIGLVLEDLFSGLFYYTPPPPFTESPCGVCFIPTHTHTHSPNRFGESAAKEPLVIDDNHGGVGGIAMSMGSLFRNRWLPLTARLDFNTHYLDSVFFKLCLHLSILCQFLMSAMAR